ncbi:Putative cytochrome P450 136 [Streptomyces hundungensis]|uniref:Cytochrome P450 136 n=1 Tax=Streptomyces hundungensis TaxID=1077946 RepID=A0A387HC65_9ACTN|nr:cytochrome P450 [Streptomyces hundungensis]AYG78357.1 Putative cytochrome P450 136 [Streptomyces hundungensis]
MSAPAVGVPAAGAGEGAAGHGAGCPAGAGRVHLAGPPVGPGRVHLAGPAVAERFFAAGDDELSHADGWNAVFGGRFGRGVLNLDGERHRSCRQALAPLLRRSAVKDHQDLITELLARAARKLPVGTPVDLHAFTQPLAFTVAARLFAGMDEDEANELLALFGELRTPPAGELGTPGGNRAARRVGRARRRVREMLRVAVGRLEDVDGPVRRLRALPDPPPDELIGENIAILILAGYETTGYLSARLLWLLARHPREQQAVREEGGDPSTAPRLDAVFQETARLHPPLAWLPRRARSHLDLGGLQVPAGTEVFYSVSNTQRDPELFADPHTFRPERFAERATGDAAEGSTGAERHGRFALTPFGAGRRICVGIHLGTLETKLIVSGLVREFRLTAPDGLPIGDVSHNGSTVTSAAPLLARLDWLFG